ncbi:MAG: thioredoxin family protein [Bacteroidetes bacterium]|nr:thioredoxin family protein [Bacteroidota bacterium]
MAFPDNLYRLIQSEKPVLLMFHSYFDGSSRMLKRELERFECETDDQIHIIILDIDDHPDLGHFFGIRIIPLLFLFQSGQMLWRNAGGNSRDRIRETLMKHFPHLIFEIKPQRISVLDIEMSQGKESPHWIMDN